MLETLLLTALLLPAGSTAPHTQPEPEPYEGEWVVEIIDHIKVMPESRVTMRIEGQTISGLASCNTYRGSFTVTGTTVKVGEFLKTMKACDPARMGEERDFVGLMREVVRYEITFDDRLVLTTADQRTIVAKRP